MTRHEVLEKLLASAEFHDQAHDIVTAIFGPKGEGVTTDAIPSDPNGPPTKG